MAAQIRAAYAFHERKALLRKAAEEEIRPDEATLSAIGRVRVELEDRTRKRLPVATDRTAVSTSVQRLDIEFSSDFEQISLARAISHLYRSRIWQYSIHVSALVEIYKIIIPFHRSKVNT